MSEKMKSLLFFLCVCGIPSAGAAQQADGRIWSLEDCMVYAVQNSTKVKKQEYTNDSYRHIRRSAVADMLPSLSASANGQLTTGRGIDPGTNTYSTISNFGNTYGVYASLPVFNGFALINKVVETRMQIRSGQSELQRIKDDICLGIVGAYYDAVYYRRAMGIAQDKLERSRQNVYKTKKMEELGLRSEADVAQMNAALVADNFVLVQQENSYVRAMMSLKDYMNFPTEDSLAVDTLVSQKLTILEESPDRIYEKAAEENPLILRSAYQVEIQKAKYAQAKGRMLPSLSLSGGYSTNYYTNLTGDRSHVRPFNTQMDQNKGGYLTLSLSVPIFSGFSKRTTLATARNNLRIAEQENVEIHRDLRNAIDKAVLERNSQAKQYYLARQQVESDALAYQAFLRRYEEGLASSLDVRTSANTLMDSQLKELRAYLYYLLYSCTVDYYKGVPLIPSDKMASL